MSVDSDAVWNALGYRLRRERERFAKKGVGERERGGLSDAPNERDTASRAQGRKREKGSSDCCAYTRAFANSLSLFLPFFL